MLTILKRLLFPFGMFICYIDPPGDDKKTSPAPDPAKELADARVELATLKSELEKLKAPKPKEDADLIEKARLQREESDKKNSDSKALEKAITFNLKSEEFLKKNESLLPKDIQDVFALAQKETYGNAIEKDAAIKSGIVQSFFAIQANVDLLTPSLKASLDDYLKLTKNGKQEKAQAIYDSVFEPAFEMLKRIKKAEILSKGHSPEDDSDTAYKNKMIKISRQAYLGEK